LSEPQQETDPVWRRLDEHGRQLSALERHTEVLDQRIESMEARQDRQFSEITQSLARIEQKQDQSTETISQAKGGLRVLLWVSGAAATVAGLVIAAWKALTGG